MLHPIPPISRTTDFESLPKPFFINVHIFTNVHIFYMYIHCIYVHIYYVRMCISVSLSFFHLYRFIIVNHILYVGIHYVRVCIYFSVSLSLFHLYRFIIINRLDSFLTPLRNLISIYTESLLKVYF